MREQLRPLEKEISETKRELNELFRAESLASREGDAARARQTHLALLEKELDNVRSITTYVDTISPPVARDLSRWHTQTASRFRELRETANPAALQAWVARELVPLLRRSELVAHLVATGTRVVPKKSAAPFAWPVAKSRAMKGAQGGRPRHGNLR